MKIILNGNHVDEIYAKISQKDFRRVSAHKWYLSANGYAQTNMGGRTVYMHRFILNTPDDMYTDHINHDRLDNRRSNIRICTPTENNLNRSRRGYYFDKSNNTWYASCRVDGKIIRRHFHTKEEAMAVAEKMKKGDIPKSKRDLS